MATDYVGEVRACIVSMLAAVDECADHTLPLADMWAEIDGQCQALSTLCKEGPLDDDGEHDDEGDAGIEGELDFDEDGELEGDGFDDDNEVH